MNQLSPVTLLRLQAGKLKHAEIRDRVVDHDGKVLEGERIFHYLTCKRCELERKAFEIENFYRDYVLA